MAAWFDTLPALEKVFLFIALPSSLILLIQTVMLFFGGVDDGSLGADTSGFAPHTDPSVAGALAADYDDISGSFDGSDLSFITVRGIVAFLSVAGWTGVTCMEMGVSAVVSVFVAILFGFGALVGVAYLVRALLGLQTVNRVNYRAALGLTGDVYLPIPAEAQGTGKVSLTLGGVYKQYDAVTNSEQAIKTGETVRVVDVIRENVFIVEIDE